MAMTVSTSKLKIKLEPAVIEIASIYEPGQQSKNLREMEGSDACSKSEITSEEQFAGENTMTDAGKLELSSEIITANYVVSYGLGILEKSWKLGKEKGGEVANRPSEFKSSQISRNHVGFDLTCTERFSCDFSDYTPSPFIDSGSQISKRSVKETPSTTFSPFLLYIKGFSGLTSPSETAINVSVGGEGSLQPESVRFEDGKDEGSFLAPRKRQPNEAISSNYAATYCSAMEYVEHDVQERSQMVDSIGEAHESGTTETAQNSLSEEPSEYHGSGNGGEGSGTGENDGGEGFEGVFDGGGDNAEVPLQEVLLYANGAIITSIPLSEYGSFETLLAMVHCHFTFADSLNFGSYGYTLFYKRALDTTQGVEDRHHDQLFPLGSLLGDPSWSTDPWEKIEVELTEIHALAKTKVVRPPPQVFSAIRLQGQISKSLDVGIIKNLAERIPGRVAITVNGSVMNYYDFSHCMALHTMVAGVYGILIGHENWDFLDIYGYDISYICCQRQIEMFPSEYWPQVQWEIFLENLSEIRVCGRCDIFSRLECERGRLSLAATSGFLHEYVTRNGSLRGYFTRGRRGGRRRGHLLHNRLLVNFYFFGPVLIPNFVLCFFVGLFLPPNFQPR